MLKRVALAGRGGALQPGCAVDVVSAPPAQSDRTAAVIEQIRCSRLVGRADELDFLRERCNEARLGRGSLVFINGDAGIGKTRLVDEAIRRAKLTMHHGKGFCLEHARSPLGPLADIVRAVHAADKSILTMACNVRRVLARLVPELETGTAPDAEAQGARSQYAAIAEMFHRFGEGRAALLVIEDAHWADVSTAEFLKYYAARVGESNVVLLIVSRTDVADATQLSPVIAELRRRRSVHALDIEPLSAAQMQCFMRTALGSQALPHDVLHEISELADGNPLFAEELLASALAKRSGPQTLPPTIREIFSQRIERLDREDRDILVEAAVIGRRFDPAFLARLTTRPLERIFLALRRARALQLVVEASEEDGSGVVFRHALVRETLYASILAAEARGMHRGILRELEVLPDRKQHVAALAYHSWAAGETATAMAYNEIAADDAMARLATNEAALAYERALSCSRQTERRRAELQRKLGAAFSASGWSQCAIDMYERAYAFVARPGDGESIAEICAALGREYMLRGDGDAALRWRIAALEAVESVPEGAVRTAAHASLALMYAWRGETAKAEEIVRRAGRLDATGPPAARQDLHDAQATLDLFAGRSAEALTRYRLAANDAAAAHNTALAVRAYCNYSDTARVIGEFDLARHAADEALRLADEVVVPLYRPTVLVDCGLLSAQAGALETARRRLAEAEDAVAGFDAPRVHAQLVRLGLMLAKALDDPALEERYADDRAIDAAFLSREAWWMGSIAGVFAERFGRMGRSADAQLLIHRGLALMPALIHAHELAIAAAAYGADADLAPAREKLVHWAQRVKPAYGEAFVELFDTHVQRRSGHSPAALGTLAARHFEQLGLPLWAADGYEAAGERAAALEIYLRIGSSGGILRLTAPPAVDLDGAQLTKREREVLFHVSGGRSNREIADDMGISERTVESHIRAILGKVGGRSRHDIIKLASVHALR